MVAQVLIFACLSVVGLAATTEDCPAGVKKDKYLKVHGDNCYQFVLNQKKSFQDAQDYCKENGGNLAIVKSESVNEYLRGIAKDSYVLYYTPLWIGLNSEHGAFSWVDGSKLDYNNLDKNDLDTESDFCIAMAPGKKSWPSYRCNSDIFYTTKNRFICEYPLSVSTTDSQCPVRSDGEDDIKEFEDKCYYFGLGEKLSFPKAEAYCEKYGGKLALVKSRKINDFLQHHLSVTHNLKLASDSTWIGLKYLNSYQKFYWVDGTVLQYGNFKSTSSYADCVTMSPSDGRWSLEYCSDTSIDANYFICEFDMVTSMVTPTIPTKPKTTPTTTKKPTPPSTIPTTAVTSTTNKRKCPLQNDGDDYVQILDGKCYYFAMKEKLTFNKARDFCTKYGGILALPKTQKINQFLQHHLHVTHDLGYSSDSLWIGLKYSSSYYAFRWLDGTSSLQYNNFRQYSKGGCGAISPTDGEWEKEACTDSSGVSKHFICEFDTSQK